MGGSAIVADVWRRGPGRLFISIAPSRRRAGASWAKSSRSHGQGTGPPPVAAARL